MKEEWNCGDSDRVASHTQEQSKSTVAICLQAAAVVPLQCCSCKHPWKDFATGSEQLSVFQLFHKLSDGLTMCCVGHSASMGACHHERKARDWQHARLVYQYGGQALEDTRFLLAYPSKRLKTEERTALTRAIPDDNVVGTEQNIAKPVAKASLSKGIFRKANPSNGVRPRIDISPNIKPAGALNASIASCVFSVKPEITKMVHR